MDTFFENRFKNKVMIVTGATSGIGRAVALRAAKEGAKLVLTGRRIDAGESLVNEIKALGGDAIFLSLDLCREDSAKQLIEKAVAKYGQIDIAVNNAGIMGSPCPLADLEKDEMDKVINANFYSVYFCCKYELQQLVSQNSGGVIINNASVAGIVGVPGLPAYNASKHAVNGLTKNLAIDYAKYNIRVNSVNPASTNTPLLQNSIELAKKEMAELVKQHKDPSSLCSFVGQKNTNIQGRPSTPEEQAASILFLASEDATHMTGAVLQTDGGWTSF